MAVVTSAALGDVHALVRRMVAAEHLLLLLDYDGTLVAFASTPELAVPDAALVGLLRALAARPSTQVHVVSGRDRETMERWLGHLPIGLHAEHGFWTRPPGGSWCALQAPAMEWRESARAIMENVAARTPGALVEEKTAALAWHYRMADPVCGAARADELRRRLAELASNSPVEILAGNKVIELRPSGVHKGAIVGPLLETLPARTLVVAVGDDRTDEDLFAALPVDAIAIHVGPGPSQAPVRFDDLRDVRRLLSALIGEPPGGAAPRG